MKTKLLLPTHHSVSDWDKSDLATYILDPDYYVSTPKSLRIGWTGATLRTALFLCRIDETLVLPEGRIVTQVRYTPFTADLYLWFRNQSALGTATFDNGYQLRILPTELKVYRYIAGSPHLVGTIVCITPKDLWLQYRLTWWNGVTPGVEEALAVMIERWDGFEWVQQGDWLYDTANQFKDSAINRCGVGSLQVSTIKQWFDDTEIWGP